MKNAAREFKSESELIDLDNYNSDHDLDYVHRDSDDSDDSNYDSELS